MMDGKRWGTGALGRGRGIGWDAIYGERLKKEKIIDFKDTCKSK